MDDEDPAAQESGGESGGDSSRSDERQVWDSWDESTGEVWSDESGSEATGAVEGTGLWEECAEDDEAVLTAADELSSDEEYEIVGEGEVEVAKLTPARKKARLGCRRPGKRASHTCLPPPAPIDVLRSPTGPTTRIQPRAEDGSRQHYQWCARARMRLVFMLTRWRCRAEIVVVWLRSDRAGQPHALHESFSV
jgi:hypothetical protein